MEKISVILDANAKIASLGESASVVVFAKNHLGWNEIKNIPTSIDFSKDTRFIREELRELVEELNDSKIIVGKQISGVSYYVFDKMGLAIFEVKQFTTGILDAILFDMSRNKAEVEHTKSITPIETDVAGVYFLDLISLQNQNPNISSKMALQPFLSNTPFLQLNIVCAHIPPWIEDFIAKKGLSLKSEKTRDEKIQLSIMNTCCE